MAHRYPPTFDFADAVLPAYVVVVFVALSTALLLFRTWRDTVEGSPHPDVDMKKEAPRLISTLHWIGCMIFGSPKTESSPSANRVHWRFRLAVVDFVANDLPVVLRWAVYCIMMDRLIAIIVPNIPYLRQILVLLFNPSKPRKLMKKVTCMHEIYTLFNKCVNKIYIYI